MTPGFVVRHVRIVGVLALACALAAGVLRPASTSAQVTDAELVRFGAEVVALVNARNAEGLAALFTAADITCPGFESSSALLCQGRPSGTVVQGYWVGPLYSELGAVDSAGLRASVNLGLGRAPAPASLATIARRAAFPFLRERCPDCGTIVVAGTPPPAGGQPALIFSVKSTSSGPRLFSLIIAETLQPDEIVYVTGGTHRFDGTDYLRPGVLPPQVGSGLARSTGVVRTPLTLAGAAVAATGLVLSLLVTRPGRRDRAQTADR